LFAPLTTFVSPSAFPFVQSILFLFVVIIGGAGTVVGPLIGAALIVLLPEYLSSLAEYRLLFFGALLLGVLWIAPEGVAGALAKRLRRPSRALRPADGLEILAWLGQRAHGQALKIAGLSLAFGGIRAVTEVDFTVRSGQITSLIGPNGAGKTTVLNVLSGFYLPDAGRVTLGEHQVIGLPSYAIARLGIARTYQTTALFPSLSVLDNLLIARRRGSPMSTREWWKSPGPWRHNRGCSCWMSRLLAWDRRTPSASASCCDRWPRPGLAWCWSNTTCRW